MKITIDIIDDEYLPECPHCKNPVDIDYITSGGAVHMDHEILFICGHCFHAFDVELIVTRARTIEQSHQKDVYYR